MKIVCLEGFLAEIGASVRESTEIVGVPDGCQLPDTLATKPKMTGNPHVGLKTRSKLLEERLSFSRVNVDALVLANPDVILTSLPDIEALPLLREELFSVFGRQVFLFHHAPIRLDEVYEMFEDIGRQLKAPEKGRNLSHRVKAQIMDWCANFYDRIKNKRVTFLSSIEPLMLGGRWIPDMIRVASGHSQGLLAQKEDNLVRWEEVVNFNPDVIIVAPKNLSFPETLKTFKKFETFPNWEKIYAVKRGDVFFTDGTAYFNKPTSHMIESMGILVSAMAGFESGYITPRDSMYKLRYLEMHRHKFL